MKKIEKYWDNGLAEFRYELKEECLVDELRLQGAGAVTTGRKTKTTRTIAVGDRAWAERTAKHYNLRLGAEQ